MSDQQPEINLQDIHQIKVILDVVCNRGAIHAHEMEAVGTVYNKLSKLLEANKSTDKSITP